MKIIDLIPLFSDDTSHFYKNLIKDLSDERKSMWYAFPLLKKLYEVGTLSTKKFFKEGIARMFKNGHPTIIQYLIKQHYLKVLDDEDVASITRRALERGELATILELMRRDYLKARELIPLFYEKESKFYENLEESLADEKKWSSIALPLLETLIKVSHPITSKQEFETIITRLKAEYLAI